MRHVIVNNIVSLDGYYADSTGTPLALNMDAAFDQANLDSIAAADVVLLGRESFEGFSSYWPFIADAPAPTVAEAALPEARRLSEVNRAISRRYTALPKVVVSDSGPIAAQNPWAQTTTVVPRDRIAAWLADARQADSGDIVIFGSRRTWNGLLRAGLIDELRLMVSPNALGAGVNLFSTSAELELIECRRFTDSSNVQLRYRVLPSRGLTHGTIPGR